MSGTLIDGKSIANKLNEKTAVEAAVLKKNGITPKLVVILVGADKPSQTYVRNKGKTATKVGIDFELVELPADISKAGIIEKIDEIQNDPDLSGVIVQLPLPEPLYTDDVLNAIDPMFDVDCLTNANMGRLVMKTNYIVPPTPGAAMSVLRHLGVKDNLRGKNVTIIGVGALVGKPLSIMMMNEGASVTTCNSKTKDTKEKCLNADIIVTGVGKKDILRGNMVKKGAIVIDTGVCFVDDQMYGDVNVEEVIKKASHVTPTPGGIGPITVARLLHNTIICAKMKYDANHDSNQQINTNLQNYKSTNTKNTEDKLIHKDLSYKINGILFQVHNELGRYCNEKQICDRIEHLLKEEGLDYKRELVLPPSFKGEFKGRNRIDFIIENKIILEVKCTRFLGREEYYQTQRYIHAFNIQLGIMVNFRDERINPRRILNSEYKNSSISVIL